MPRNAPLTAKSADRHELYQRAVQVPEADVRFLDRVFRKRFGRPPRVLREDFCGTAFLSATWAASRADREAYGVDLCAATMAWGRTRNLRPLGAAAGRVHLLRADVRTPKRPRADVQVAFNFSYWILKTRADLLAYFRAARASLRKEGLFVVDVHGGSESFVELKEPRRMPGFRYVWEQSAFNPVTHEIRCHIHFEFRDGTRLRNAFTYDWRWWSLMEVRDALRDAGFAATEVYWEGTERATDEGNGVYRLAQRGDNDPSWVAYVVAVP